MEFLPNVSETEIRVMIRTEIFPMDHVKIRARVDPREEPGLAPGAAKLQRAFRRAERIRADQERRNADQDRQQGRDNGGKAIGAD